MIRSSRLEVFCYVETDSFNLVFLELEVASYELKSETPNYWNKCELNHKTSSYQNCLRLDIESW